MAEPNPAGEQLLCALLAGLRTRSGLTYEQLAARASCSRGTVVNYLTKPGHRRDQSILKALLTALGAEDIECAEAVRLHRLALPESVDPGLVGWATVAVAANCATWEMVQFTHAEATVHTAIGRHSDHTDQHELASPPPYVPRAHDTALRADLSAAACGDLSALVVLRGGSSTGKTRSLFEAVQALCPGWAVVRPRSVAALRGLPGSGLVGRRACVVWLNELQVFLGPNGIGLSLDVLRDLFAAAHNRAAGRTPRPVVVVATLWPEKLHGATARQDRLSDNRDLLTAASQWVRWHDVPQNLLASERATARALAASSGDARLDAALTDPDRVGFAQTLAGAYELLQHYTTAPHPLNRLLLDAAADVRRLGHTQPLTAPTLREITLGLWREERGQTSPPTGWFDTALAYATEPLRSTQGVQTLIPLVHSATDSANGIENDLVVGYDLADYLEQHLVRTRRNRPIGDATWAALLRHSFLPDDLIALADSAVSRGRFSYAESLYRAADNPRALHDLAKFLAKRPGREHDAEQAYREAVAAGVPGALMMFADWLTRSPGREHDIEQSYRSAIAERAPGALSAFAGWLTRQPGREVDAEQVLTDAVAAGHSFALNDLARWLGGQPGREAEAEQAYKTAAAGRPTGLYDLARWLEGQPRREADAEQAYRTAAARDSFVLHNFVDWLIRQPGRKADAEQALTDAVAAGDRTALSRLAWLLAGLQGREHDAEQAFRDASAAGHPLDLGDLGTWLSRQPGREADAEQAYRDAIAAGNRQALRALADLLARQPGRQADAEQAFHDAIAANHPFALHDLAAWLTRQPGRKANGEEAYRNAAAAGDPDALPALADWLSGQPGREADAEQTYRDAVAAGNVAALHRLGTWLTQQPGREHDAEHLARFGLDALDSSDVPTGRRAPR